ncbi:hypothetical protein [uncultured Boseongicola sp.]|nr:hypothetical protein [uncultured Boseongicola sp.]
MLPEDRAKVKASHPNSTLEREFMRVDGYEEYHKSLYRYVLRDV